MRRLRQAESVQEKGFVLAFMAISMLTIVIVMGFAVDVGAWYLTASRLQRSADSAALAGAISLPDQVDAAASINAAYERNNLKPATDPSIDITNEITSGYAKTTVTNHNVQTYFTHMFLPHISISRTSQAARATNAPAIGSPFNVLGTGDLSIPGLVGKQNFWLSINGECTAKEDGDYFNSRYDANKGPFTGLVNPNGSNQAAANATTHCDQSDPNYAVANPTYNSGAGYSYFVDVPKPMPGGTVRLKVRDGAYHGEHGDANDNALQLPGDRKLGWETQFTVFKINNPDAPDDTSPGAQTLVSQVLIDGYDTRDDNGIWVLLYDIPNSEISAAGGKYRIQVTTPPTCPGGFVSEEGRGVNNFSLGAFMSWRDGQACDSRVPTEKQCPRIYGRNAMSVSTNFSGAAGTNASFYFAEIDPTYVGLTFHIFMWDPGEGTESIQILQPDGTPLTFDYKTSDGLYQESGVQSIDTSGRNFAPRTANLSNTYKFNDRLIDITATLPADYVSHIGPNDDDWLRIQYTLGATSGDRTTWGLTVGGSTFSPPHLVRPGSVLGG